MFQRLINELKSLPVVPHLDAICEGVIPGSVTIITAETGSGKTLTIPARLHDVTGQQILVLEPRRPLAIQAAETVAKMSDLTLGVEIGYAISDRGGEDEKMVDFHRNRIIYATYGYALKSGLINQANIVVFDEVHDLSSDTSLALALLKKRLATETNPPAILVMSATLDETQHRKYWADHEPRIFYVKDPTNFTCTRRYQRTSVENATIELLHEGRHGIIVFLPGMSEIEDIRERFELAVRYHPELVNTIDTVSLSGRSSYQDRLAAWAAPQEDRRKVLFCTNVAESGFNLPWVDAGVTAGTHKELVVTNNGTISLRTVPLSQDRVLQQQGRTNRFTDSTFVLCGPVPFEQMERASTPEIIRLPLTSLVMHCISLGYQPDELDFLPYLPTHAVLDAMQSLRRLGFIDDKNQLTDDGVFTQSLPVGLETAALLCHARKLKCLDEVLILAACHDVGDLRFKRYEDIWRFRNEVSDTFESVQACAFTLSIWDNNGDVRQIDGNNINRKRVREVFELVQTLRRHLASQQLLPVDETVADGQAYYDYVPYLSDVDNWPEDRLARFRQCLLAANVLHMGRWDWDMSKVIMAASTTGPIPIARSSSVLMSHRSTSVSAQPRTITPRHGGASFVVAENLTVYLEADLEAYALVRPEVFERVYDPETGELLQWLVFGDPLTQRKRPTPPVEIPPPPTPLEKAWTASAGLPTTIPSVPSSLSKVKQAIYSSLLTTPDRHRVQEAIEDIEMPSLNDVEQQMIELRARKEEEARQKAMAARSKPRVVAQAPTHVVVPVEQVQVKPSMTILSATKQKKPEKRKSGWKSLHELAAEASGMN